MSDDGYQQLFAHLTRKKRRTAKGRCAVSTGSLSVLSAEALAAKWEKRSEELIARASKWEDEHPHHGDEGTRGEADGYRSCAQELRRQMGLTSYRQPKENNFDQPTPAENRKPQ